MPRENALGLIAAKDRDDFALLMAAFRANGRTLGGVSIPQEGLRDLRTVLIGKPDSSFTKGILSAPNNVVSLWGGPAKSSDADTGANLTVHYATADCATTDYVVCERINGKWYVTPLECAE